MPKQETNSTHLPRNQCGPRASDAGNHLVVCTHSLTEGANHLFGGHAVGASDQPKLALECNAPSS